MELHPLPRALYDRCIALGVVRIVLNFSGGSDEGFLSVVLLTSAGRLALTTAAPTVEQLNPEGLSDSDKLEGDIHDWADDVYDYNGAGEGQDYGDDIVYDLEFNLVTHDEWYMERTDGDSDGGPLCLVTENGDTEELPEIQPQPSMIDAEITIQWQENPSTMPATPPIITQPPILRVPDRRVIRLDEEPDDTMASRGE